MRMLLKRVLFAILKNVLRTFIQNSESKVCGIKRALKRNYNNEDEILQQRRDKYARLKDLDSWIKAMEERPSIITLSTWIANIKVMCKTEKMCFNFRFCQH